MNRPLIICCFALALLSACAMGDAQPTKEPVITYVPVTHDVVYPRYMVIPSDKQEQQLQRFLKESARNPGGNIALSVANAGDARMEERLGDLRQLMEGWGYKNLVIVEDKTIPAEHVRVISSEVQASSPDCPDWSYGYMANYRNTVLSNHGCASANNLARMVEDPDDLVNGTGDSGADAVRGSGIIDTYREPPPAPQTGNNESMTGGS